MKKIFLIFLLFPLLIKAQTEFSSFLNHVNGLETSTQKQAAVDSFITYASTIGIPFIENNSAVFLYKGNASSVMVTGDFTGWSANGKVLQKISGTTLFYYSQNFESTARLDYKLILNGSSWILDPLNPNRVPGGFGANSELAMPDYIQPYEIISNPNSSKGTLESTLITSKITGKTYSVKIYLPNDYYQTTKDYPTVYFHDGSDYLAFASAQTVLDNLIHLNKIEKIIAVFVKPNNRNEEYAFSLREKYSEFFTSELVEIIDSTYRTIDDPKKRLTIGDSFGGNISALISYNYPKIFGLCGLHSAAFWPNEYEVFNLIINGEVKNISYYSIWGTYESLFQNMRDFRDIMKNKEYSLEWKEFPEGHSWGLWRANIDVMLEHFFPADLVSVESEISISNFTLEQNYPNPFNPTTSIEYLVPNTEFVSLKVYDILGNEISTLVNEIKAPGKYEVNFDSSNFSSGIYFYKLTAGNFSKVKKMMLVR